MMGDARPRHPIGMGRPLVKMNFFPQAFQHFVQPAGRTGVTSISGRNAEGLGSTADGPSGCQRRAMFVEIALLQLCASRVEPRGPHDWRCPATCANRLQRAG